MLRQGSGPLTTSQAWAARIALLVGLGLAWQLSPERYVPESALSRPDAVFDQLRRWMADSVLQEHLVTTLRGLAIAVVVSIVVGTIPAFAGFYLPVVREAIAPLIGVVNAVPKHVFVPLYALALGLGTYPKVLLSVSFFSLIIYFHVDLALQGMSQWSLRAVRLMGGNRREVFRYVVWPSTVGALLGAVRLGTPLAFAAIVFGEMSRSADGLGWLLARSAGFGSSAGVMAGMLVCAAIGWALDALVVGLEARAGRWRV